VIVKIEDQEMEVNPVTLRIEDDAFACEGDIRQAVDAELLDDLLSKYWYTEPVPCGIRAILDTADKLNDIALLACHHGLHEYVGHVHQKMCSHLSECVPQDTCEKEMIVEAARCLCQTESLLKEFRNEQSTGIDN
jgi:hypothetical protein